MSYHVKIEHLIGDKPVPYELPCRLHAMDKERDEAIVEVSTPSGMAKVMHVRADQVYFKLEAV